MTIWIACLSPHTHSPGTGTCAMEARTHTAAGTDPVDEERGCAAGFGHRAHDQLVVVNQILPIHHGMADLLFAEGRQPCIVRPYGLNGMIIRKEWKRFTVRLSALMKEMSIFCVLD